MHSLPVFVRLTGETVLVIGEGDTADAKRRLVERAGGIVTRDPALAVRFAFVVLDDHEEAAATTKFLKARGIIVNVTDFPDLCDFIMPAIIDRDPVIIAIGTGGTSAGLAKALRQRIEAFLPADLGKLANALFAQRDMIRTRWTKADDRRRAIDAGLSEGGFIDPLVPGAAKRVDQWLAAPHGQSGALHHIIVTSDDPDDLTIKAARLLGQADEIWHQSAVAPAILHRARADAKQLLSDAPPPEDAATGGRIVIWLTKA